MENEDEFRRKFNFYEEEFEVYHQNLDIKELIDEMENLEKK